MASYEVGFELEDAPPELRHAVVGIPVRVVRLRGLLPALSAMSGRVHDGRTDFAIDDEPPTLRWPHRRPGPFSGKHDDDDDETPFPLSRVSRLEREDQSGATFAAILLGTALTFGAMHVAAPRLSTLPPAERALDEAALDTRVPAASEPEPSATAVMLATNEPERIRTDEATTLVATTREFSRPAALWSLDKAAFRASACARDDRGTARVQVTFGPNGRVANAIEGGDFAGTDIASCIEQAFRGAEIAPYDGEPVTIVRKVTLGARPAPLPR